MAAATLPLGDSFMIRHAEHTAVIREVGATLRSYEADGHVVVRDMVRPKFSDVFKGGHGQVLMPWVNRVSGGKYTIDDTAFQLAITEPAKNNANHGFVRFARWDAVEQSQDRITFGLRSFAQPGYPFVFDARVTYSVSQAGLTVEMSARNMGSHALPFGMGMHPYVTTGSPYIDDDAFVFGASQYIPVDDCGIPNAKPSTVDETPNDFRNGKSLDDAVLDVAVCNLKRDQSGRANATLRGSERAVTVWMDETFDYAMVFTGDTLSVPDERRRSLAIEPMSCAADAFNNSMGLRWLTPGESFSGTWGVVSTLH